MFLPMKVGGSISSLRFNLVFFSGVAVPEVWAFPFLSLPFPLPLSALAAGSALFSTLNRARNHTLFATLAVTTGQLSHQHLTLHWLSLHLYPFSDDILLEAAAAEILRCSPTGHRESPHQRPAAPWPTPEAATRHRHNINWLNKRHASLQFIFFYIFFYNWLIIYSEK